MQVDAVSKINAASQMLKGVAHPLRLAIMEMLVDQKQMCVTDIHENLEIEQAVASQHLKILKDRGIIHSEKVGKQCFYSIQNDKFKQLLKLINECNDCH